MKNRKIFIYQIEDMIHTPFEHKTGVRVLNENNIFFTDNPNKCDIYVTNWLASKNLLNTIKFLLRYKSKKKPILIWTHEPRYNTFFQPIIKGNTLFPDVYVMNIYTGEVFINNYNIYGYHIDRIIPSVTADEIQRCNNKAVAFATYVKELPYQDLIHKGKNIDLAIFRQKLLIEGNKQNLIDIYGRFWPEGKTLKEPENTDTVRSKHEILTNYKFNVCLENTDFDYYVSEKIWHAIKARTLPVYRGGGQKIYDDFPKNSFIDTQDFKSIPELLDYLKNISDSEYIERTNLCIETFNKLHSQINFNNEYRDTILRIADKIKQIKQNI